MINIDFIIISVRFNNKSYIFCHCILNLRVLFGRTLCQLMEHLQPKTGNFLAICFWFSLFLLVLCVPVHENHKHVQGILLLGKTSCQIIE